MPARSVKAPPGIAFFDFDNTLIHGDAGPLFGKHLFSVRRQNLSRPRRLFLSLRYVPYIFWMVVQRILYAVRARRRSSLVRSAYRGLKGVPVDLFESDLDRFIDDAIPPRIYPELVAEVQMHLKAGRRCVVVTTGMEQVVTGALRYFPPGVETIGCRMRERNGRLTGRVVGPLFGVDKANIMHAYARALRIELGHCWAYSDHFSDKQMLEAVGHPVAVNPRGRLRKLALRNGWKVIDPEPREAKV